MVILTGPRDRRVRRPETARQGFLDGLKEGGPAVRDQGRTSRRLRPGTKGPGRPPRNMLAGKPRHRLDPRPQRLHGPRRLQRRQRQKTSTRTSTSPASADGQKEALALIKQGGCDGRYISTGLNSPSPGRRRSVEDLHRRRHRQKPHPPTTRPESFTEAVGIGCDNINDYYDPKQRPSDHPNSVF